MPFTISSQIEGLEGALGLLREFPKRIAKTTLRKAVNEASKILLKAAKEACPRVEKSGARAHVAPGQLRRSLGRKVKVYPSGRVVAIVGARKNFRVVGFRPTLRAGKKNPAGTVLYSNPVKYLHLVELGTKRSRAYHFLRDAQQRAAGRIRGAMTEAITAGIDAALAKGGA